MSAELAGLWAPFLEFGFMRRALAASLALSASAAPLGTILMLRRMSLAGDAMSHAILPGVAFAYLLFGLSLPAMTAGGLLAGLLVAALASLVARRTQLREDASLAAFYLMSLALGVLLISLRGSNVDLLHLLFGSVLSLDDATLLLCALVTTVTLFALALVYRPLLIDCLDPGFLQRLGRRARSGTLAHGVFMLLLVLNLVTAFHALGTLMAVAYVVLPAAAARFWVRGIGQQMLLAMAMGLLGSVLGLLASFHLDLAASSAITLSLGILYLLSLVVGRQGSVIALRRPAPALSGLPKPGESV